MATNLPPCFFIQFLELLLKVLVNFTLLKYVKSQRNYDFLITKELIFGFQILDLKDHFSASFSLVSFSALLCIGGNKRQSYAQLAGRLYRVSQKIIIRQTVIYIFVSKFRFVFQGV